MLTVVRLLLRLLLLLLHPVRVEIGVLAFQPLLAGHAALHVPGQGRLVAGRLLGHQLLQVGMGQGQMIGLESLRLVG